MALATSASEFFTSMVGVFFVKSDIACKLIGISFYSLKIFNIIKNRKLIFYLNINNKRKQML